MMDAHWRTARQMSGDNHLPGLTTARAVRTPNLISFPPGSLLEPVKVSEPPVHKFSVIQSAALSIITAAALFFAIIILLFVEVQ